MEKVLPILAAVAAVLAALYAIVVSGAGAALLLVLVALAAGVLAILQRDRNGVLTGIGLVLLALLGAFVAVGSVSFEGGDDIGGTSDEQGNAMAVAVGLLTAAAIVPARWHDLSPRWVGVAGVAAALIGVLVAFTGKGGIGQYTEGVNYGIAVLALAAGVPAGISLVGRRKT